MNELAFLEQPSADEDAAVRRAQLIEAEVARLEAGAGKFAEEQIAKIRQMTTLALDTPTLPDSPAKTQQLFTKAWSKLTEHQKVWLYAYRDANYSARLAGERLAGTPYATPHYQVGRWWGADGDFKFCKDVLQHVGYDMVIAKQRLVMRADEIAERAMIPKPILYQGAPTGFYEMEADVALRANEQVAKLAGHLKQGEAPRVRVRFVNLSGDSEIENQLTAAEVEVGASELPE